MDSIENILGGIKREDKKDSVSSIENILDSVKFVPEIPYGVQQEVVDAAMEYMNSCFDLAKENPDKWFDSFLKDKLHLVNNDTINEIISERNYGSGSLLNDYHTGDMLTYLISNSFIDEIKITQNVSDIERISLVGENAAGKKMIISGNAGKEVGSKMTHGKIQINGNADYYCGSGMIGGEIVVKRNADYCGAEDMTGGKITVHGNVDARFGQRMSGGEIHVHGNAGEFCCNDMKGGKFIVDGDCEYHLASGMSDGVIEVSGNIEKEIYGYQKTGGEIYQKGKKIC